jgi:pilus assembly protein CpaB
MRLVTILSLGASAVLGLGALVVAKTMLPSGGAAKAGPAGAVEAGTPVVVATSDIKFGDKLEGRMLAVAREPANLVPPGAFTTVQQVLAQDHGGAPVALAPIAAHEVILPTRLSGPGARPSVAAEIKEGMRAYTVRVTDQSGVGGHALPGDFVDVMVIRDLTPQGATRDFVSYVVLQNVRVLGVDLNADLTSNKPAEPKNATLEVNEEDAQKLSIASGLGSISLALRRSGEADIASVHPVAMHQFVGGGASAPASGDGRPAVRHHYEGARVERPALITIVAEPMGGSGKAPKPPPAPAAPASPPPPAAQPVAASTPAA